MWWSRAWSVLVRRKRWVISAAFVGAFLLGLVGWMTSGLDLWTAVYRSLRLFVLDGPDDGEISAWLSVARFVAPIVASVAIWAMVVEVIEGLLTVTSAKRQQGHTVVLGGGTEAAEIARRAQQQAQGSRVVVVGDLSASDVARLRRERVIHLAALDDVALAKVLKRAELVVISAADDGQASTWVERVSKANVVGQGRVVTLLSSRVLVDDWRGSTTEVVLCRSSQVGTAVLRQHPPYAEDAVTPAPIVIGDGRLATELARRIMEGWQRPGERLALHCVGTDETWARAAESSLGASDQIEWHPLPPSAYAVPATVRAILDRWRAFKPQRYKVAPASVYVSFDEDATTLPIANAVARELADVARVVAVFDDPASVPKPAGKVEVVGRLGLLCDPARLTRKPTDDLADEIVADLGRWPADVPSAFGPIQRTPECAAVLAEQSSEVQGAIAVVADAVGSVMKCARLELVAGPTGRPPVQVLDPAELAAIADALGELLDQMLGEGSSETDKDPAVVLERRTRLLELAAALPVFLRRVGYSLARADGRGDLLSTADIMRLAMSAHRRYLVVAEATDNATGSAFAQADWDELTEHERRSNVAQVLDIPLKLAVIGLGWECASAPALAEWGFSAAAVELLAEQEHRRWGHFEMRNARHGHEWNKPWADIKDGPVSDYDREACGWIPAHLADAGARIVSLDKRPLSSRTDVLIPVEPDAEPSPEAPEPEADSSPRRFARRGRVWAWPLDEAFDWNGPRGHRLHAQAGDWWVVGEDGSSRTVDPGSFAETYEQVAAQEYRRVGIVTAQEASVRQTVPTREGDPVAEPGDWIVTDAHGATWPVPRAVFEALYKEEERG